MMKMPGTKKSITSPRIVVSEYYMSFQGEGPNQGRLSLFIRLSGCNLQCAWRDSSGKVHVCDTLSVWQQPVYITDTEKFAKMVHTYIKKFKRKHQIRPEEKEYEWWVGDFEKRFNVVITGGEPLLQQDAVAYLLKLLKEWYNPYVEIETNGTIIPEAPLLALVDQWNVSPKIIGKLTPTNIIKDSYVAFSELEKRGGNIQWKFVIDNMETFESVEMFIKKYVHKRQNVWLMPVCETREELIRNGKWVAELALAKGYNFSNRLHIQLWDEET